MCEKSTLGRPFGRFFDPLGCQVAPKSVKLEPWGRWGASWAPLGRQVGARTRIVTRTSSSLSVLVSQVGRPGADFGPLAVPMGVPKSRFLEKINIK